MKPPSPPPEDEDDEEEIIVAKVRPISYAIYVMFFANVHD